MSTSSSTETSEARELSLVGKVELRIALADSDSKLESILKIYLPPLLLKLASEYVNVRGKVISVCQHINTRIKLPSIKLPVAALMKQYKENRNTLIRHFDLIYIHQGLDRLPKNERVDLFPALLRGISINYDESALHTANLFNVLFRLLHSINLPVRGNEDDIAFRTKLGLDDRPEDAEFVALWLGKLILFSANHEVKRCPGLSTEEYNFLQLHEKKNTWTSNDTDGMNLVETKVLAAKFLASGAFIETEKFFPALFASADPNSRLSDVGDDMLKRASSSVSLEDSKIIEKLFEIYLGTRGTEGSLPVRIPLQTKILTLLCKSKLSSSYIQQSIQIVSEGLAPSESEQQSGPLKRGLEISKLRGQVFAFTNWLARMSSPTEIRGFAPYLVSQLRDYIKSQGWPRFQSESSRPNSGELSSRCYCYESIGLLAAACPDTILFDADLDLLRWLFTSLSVDPSGNETSMSIEQALSSVLGAFGQDIDSRLEKPLTNLLLHHMGLRPSKDNESGFPVVRSTRFLAARFANRCLSYSNVTARWINILAMSEEPDDRIEVKEEGKKGLDPYWHIISFPPKHSSSTDARPTNSNHNQFPFFSDLIKQFFGPGSEWNVQKLESNRQLVNVYSLAVAFCRSVLLHHALLAIKKAPELNSDWQRNIDVLVTNDEESRIGIKTYLRQMFTAAGDDREALEIYIIASLNGMINPNDKNSNRSGECLLEICALGPHQLLNVFTKRILSLKDSILANQKSTREIAAHVFGLSASQKKCPEATIQAMLTVFDQKVQNWSKAIGSEILEVHGAMLAITYFLSRATYRDNNNSNYDELESRFLDLALDVLNNSRDKMLLDAAMVAISEFSLFSTMSSKKVREPQSFSTLLQKLYERSKLGDEKAIQALGHIAMQCNETDDEESQLGQIIETLYSLHEIRQPEIHFAVGASLTCAAVGWNSKSLISTLDIDGSPPMTPTRRQTLSSVLGKVLSSCKTTKPSLRQASVIWLLCLVQYCGHLEDVLGRLRDCQSAFKSFLTDRESLNQESASRGLTLVYEKGDRSIKDDLIRDLVGSFTGTSANLAGNVSGETELFEPGALPTGEGSVTTYKDIMSLASEVGNPELVYRFMSLASNNAIWSSRAAFGRFGLSNILSDSSVDGYLSENPKLYPALFRYRFDPNTNVRNSMNDIWNALVKEPTTTIDLYFDNIMDDLLKHILGKEWRVRQASCAAIADLVQGRPIEKYEKYLSQIWTNTFKVCDDIKVSVRTAAMSLAKILTGILTRSLEATNTSSRKADAMLEQVVPFLLSPSGLESSAQDVQAFALYTLLEIIKTGSNQTLRPFIPNLVGHLLALLSSLEPGAVNYIRLNADQYNITTEQIDDARLSNVKGSPMMEAIERCLDILDENTMAALCPSLENAIKTAIGLPSKVGSTRVLVSLATRHNFVFKIYADRFLKLARKQLLDRNDTISSAFAAACGYLARLASEEGILKLVEYCHELYFESEDDRLRTVSGELVYAISKHATDRFNSITSAVLPFVFVAKHDSLESAKSFFQDTWNENVGGSRAVLLYLKEIIDLATKYLDSPRWSLKHTSAFAISDLVVSSGSDINESNAKLIWPAMEKAIGGKTWEGKEIVLQGLVQLVKGSKILVSDASVAGQIEKIMVRESKRNNPDYRRHALACLGDFVEQANNKDLFAQVYAITEPIITEIVSDFHKTDHKMDIDSPSGGPSSKSITDATLANSIEALLKSINPKLQSDESLTSSLTQTVDLSTQVLSLGGNLAAQLATYNAYEGLFKRFRLDMRQNLSDSLENVLVNHAQTLFRVEDCVEHIRVRAAAASIAFAAQAHHNKRITVALVDTIAQARRNERSVIVQQSLDRAQKLLEK